MTESEIDATARRYVEVHGDWAWLETQLIADRHFANGEAKLFQDWVRIGKRLDQLLPWIGVPD
jgi:hypothetical protein